MNAMASHITSVSIVCSIVCSGTDQRKNLSSASLAYVRGIHRRLLDSPHKGPVTRERFPFDDVIMVHFFMPSASLCFKEQQCGSPCLKDETVACCFPSLLLLYCHRSCLEWLKLWKIYILYIWWCNVLDSIKTEKVHALFWMEYCLHYPSCLQACVSWIMDKKNDYILYIFCAVWLIQDPLFITLFTSR